MSALASDVSLAGHNIADGDVLALLPAGQAERYGPVVENVSTALAQYASEHFVRVTAKTALAVAVVIVGRCARRGRHAAVAAALGARERTAGADPVRGRRDRACSWTVAIGARVGAGRVVTDGAAWAAARRSGTGRGDRFRRGATPGAPHAFLAAVTALAGVWLLVRFTGRYWTAAAAIITAGFGAAAVALVRMYWDVPGPRIAVAVLVAVLVAVSAAPDDGAADGERPAADVRFDHGPRHLRPRCRPAGGHDLARRGRSAVRRHA